MSGSVFLRAFTAALVTLNAACGHVKVVDFDGSGQALTVHRPALYPETIEFNARDGRFLLSSFREGAIYEVDREGTASLFVDDPRLCSVLGIAVDSARNRLWAVNSNLGASIKPCASGPKQLAGVGIYDLSTGRPIDYVDLTPLAHGPHLLNGITVDAAGNAYVSDSFSPIIYKIDTHASASVFLSDQQFAGEGINLNGLVAHPDGYLLVVKKSAGVLFKVPLDEPRHFAKVASAERFIGGDGVTLLGKKDLVVIANSTQSAASNAAFALSSDDGWTTAKVSAVQPLGDVYPTTAVLRDGKLYVLHSKLNELIASPPERKAQLHEQAMIRPSAQIAH
jgi:DNA-binding beta-propeller fold protein YncE